MHTVFLAGALSTWSRLLGADPAQLSAAKKTATDLRRGTHQSRSLAAKKARTAARSWWWLWDPGSVRARVLSTAATVARHARQVRVHSDLPEMPGDRGCGGQYRDGHGGRVQKATAGTRELRLPSILRLMIRLCLLPFLFVATVRPEGSTLGRYVVRRESSHPGSVNRK